MAIETFAKGTLGGSAGTEEPVYTGFELIMHDLMTGLMTVASNPDSTPADLLRALIESTVSFITQSAKETEALANQALIDNMAVFEAWYGTDAGFWTTIGLSAVALVSFPYIYKGVVYTMALPSVKAVFESMKGIVDIAFNEATLIKIEIINSFAKTFFPSYKEMINAINQGTAGILELIGAPINTVALLINDANQIAILSADLLGQNTESAYLNGLDGVSVFLADMSENVYRYTKNPELIFSDFRDYYEKAAYDDLLALGASNSEKIENGLNTVNDTVQKLAAVSAAVNKLRTDIPEELRTGKLDYIDGLIEALNVDIQRDAKYLNDTIKPFVEDTLTILNDNANRIKELEKKVYLYVKPAAYLGNDIDAADNMINDGLAYRMMQAVKRDLGLYEDEIT